MSLQPAFQVLGTQTLYLICCRLLSSFPCIYCWIIFRSKLQYQVFSKVNSINL